MTQTMKASEVRQQWSETLNKVFQKKARILVEKSGIPVAAVISVDDLERFKRLEEARAERFKALDAMRDAFKDVPAEEIEREVQKAVDEARAEIQASKKQ